VAFLAIAESTRLPATADLDTWATTRLHEFASPSLDAVMSAVTGLGSTPLLAVIAALSVAVLARAHRTSALFVAIALVGSLVMNDALKSLYQRPRPTWEWAQIPPEYSFPSGHTMNATVLYIAIAAVVWLLRGRRAGIAALVMAVLVVLAVGLSRIYLGVHWPTDVIGGYLAGIMWLLLAAAATLAVTASIRWGPWRSTR
jgi:undecaprenyl-diphosphatase